MTLYTDIPTRAEIDALWEAAFPTSVSVYVPTEPASSGEAERIAFKNLARTALDQLAGADKNDLAVVEEALADLATPPEPRRERPLRPAEPAHDPAAAVAVRARLAVNLAAAVALRADVLAGSGGPRRRLVARRHRVADLDHHVLVLRHGRGCTRAPDE
jgi:hypothetical protein